MPDTPDSTGVAPTDSNAVTLTNADPASPPAFTLRDVFVGRDGLRAGWSLLLFIAIVFALLTGASRLGDKLHPRPATQAQTDPTASANPRASPIEPDYMLVREGTAFVCVALATWIMSRIERRPIVVYGIGRARFLPDFLAGMAWGMVLLSLLILALRSAGMLVFDARLLFGRSISRYGAIWLFGFLLVGLFEEYINRGYLQFTLTRGFSGIYGSIFRTRHTNVLAFWTAALILSFFFGLGHKANPGESPIGLLVAGIAGLVFCLSLWRTGSLWWAIGFHTTWDWAQSFLYGVADSGLRVKGHLFATHATGRPVLSGGLTGPEGSLFILPIMALISAVILLTLPRTHSGYQPADARQRRVE